MANLKLIFLNLSNVTLYKIYLKHILVLPKPYKLNIYATALFSIWNSFLLKAHNK